MSTNGFLLKTNKKYIINPLMHRREFLKSFAVFLVVTNSSVGWTKTTSDIKVAAMDEYVKDRLLNQRDFKQSYPEDIKLNLKEMPILYQAANRFKRLQKIVGYGNFSLISFDDALKISNNYPKIGPFSKIELLFLEKLFYAHVNNYGFMGEKPIKSMTETIKKKYVIKIPGTGHYLYRGKPIMIYEKVKKEVGEDLILTSGVRGVVKQFSLFLNKTCHTHGNLSMASRSLAPPGYSFHGIGDFDVGKKGYGVHNFTEQFTRTGVYQKLARLGYMKFRYERNNRLGVRFEPWHIEAA